MILQETPAAQSCRGDHACAHVAARSICFEAVIKKMAIASYHLHLCIVVRLINFSLELPIKEGAIPLAVGFLSELEKAIGPAESVTLNESYFEAYIFIQCTTKD